MVSVSEEGKSPFFLVILHGRNTFLFFQQFQAIRPFPSSLLFHVPLFLSDPNLHLPHSISDCSTSIFSGYSKHWWYSMHKSYRAGQGTIRWQCTVSPSAAYYYGNFMTYYYDGVLQYIHHYWRTSMTVCRRDTEHWSFKQDNWSTGAIRGKEGRYVSHGYISSPHRAMRIVLALPSH